MARKGRKWTINEKIIKDAVMILNAGNYVNTVCDYLGISQATWYRWFNMGAELHDSGKRKFTKEEELLIKFHNEVKKANASAEIRAVNGILEAAKENWQANAWFLERKFQDKWARKEKIEHSGGLNNVNKNIDLSNLSDEELEKELKKYD